MAKHSPRTPRTNLQIFVVGDDLDDTMPYSSSHEVTRHGNNLQHLVHIPVTKRVTRQPITTPHVLADYSLSNALFEPNYGHRAAPWHQLKPQGRL